MRSAIDLQLVRRCVLVVLTGLACEFGAPVAEAQRPGKPQVAQLQGLPPATPPHAGRTTEIAQQPSLVCGWAEHVYRSTGLDPRSALCK